MSQILTQEALAEMDRVTAANLAAFDNGQPFLAEMVLARGNKAKVRSAVSRGANPSALQAIHRGTSRHPSLPS